jgi:hypothetical protein
MASTIGSPSTRRTSVRGSPCASCSASSRIVSLKNESCRFKWPGAVTLITRTSVEYAWHHPHTSKYVKAWWKANEPRRPRPGRQRAPCLGTLCSVRHKLLEMNLLLWCQGPNIPWSDDELSVIYTSERSERWARELNSFIGRPPDVRSETWPISDLERLVRHLDPDTETAPQSGDCVELQLHQELEHQLFHQELQQQLSHQEELASSSPPRTRAMASAPRTAPAPPVAGWSRNGSRSGRTRSAADRR